MKSKVQQQISLKGVQQNNLKNIDIDIPLQKINVICGPSGSGKSSLAFETLYAEGQRRFVESMSHYMQQFVDRAKQPLVEEVKNIPPAIALKQKNIVKSSRATVGTTSEMNDYLRLFFEKLGQFHCPQHRVPLEKQSPEQILQRLLDEMKGDRAYMLICSSYKDRFLQGKELKQFLLQKSYTRILPKSSRLNLKHPENFIHLESLNKTTENVLKKDFYLIIDRFQIDEKQSERIIDSLIQAYQAYKALHENKGGKALIINLKGKKLYLSEEAFCFHCGYQCNLNLTSSLLSFNSPLGACTKCNGFGSSLSIDERKVIPNPERSLKEEAIIPFSWPSMKKEKKKLEKFCGKMNLSLNKSWSQFNSEDRNKLWEGFMDGTEAHGTFEGIKNILEAKYKKKSRHLHMLIARFLSPYPCKTCKGSRLRSESLHILFRNQSIADLTAKTLYDLKCFFQKLKLSQKEKSIAKEILQQILRRLDFLIQVGLSYLTLDRLTNTLSGGEFQRIMLAQQLGHGLSQTLYVLDEPTIGLHARDTHRLIQSLSQLHQLGNTLVLVEHDPDVILSAHHLIEMGPGSGHLGGEILFSGTKKRFLECKTSLTVSFLNQKVAQKQKIYLSSKGKQNFKENTSPYLFLKGAKGNNLKNIDIKLPLNRFVVFTGVSGSGKSTLLNHTLYPALLHKLDQEYSNETLPYDTLLGEKHLDKVLLLGQNFSGRTGRSNLATYIGAYNGIRNLIARQREAQMRGYTASYFSFNVEGGRCSFCKGLGYIEEEMIFMDDLRLNCEECEGKGFQKEVLEILFKGKNIYDILQMTVEEALAFFHLYSAIYAPLKSLQKVGLSYLKLCQALPTLSGGELQRLRIAKQLHQNYRERILYILDEPTTGLHFKEVHLLIQLLHELVEKEGATVFIIEHHSELISAADWVIDLGPEAEKKGGEVVFSGTVSELLKEKNNHTAYYLRKYLGKNSFEKNL